MNKYTLKFRGTNYVKNINANTLKEAKEIFAKNEGITSIARIQNIRKPTFQELNS